MQKKYSLLELISVTTLVSFFIILALVNALPAASKAREQAFRVEATKIVESTEKTIEKINNKEFEIEENDEYCKIDNKYCLTINSLIETNNYENVNSNYNGKVIVYLDKDNTQYEVYIKKGNEFKIIGGFRNNYKEHGVLSIQSWNEDYEKCTCQN